MPAVRGETLRSRLDWLAARHELPLLPILEAAYGQLNKAPAKRPTPPEMVPPSSIAVDAVLRCPMAMSGGLKRNQLGPADSESDTSGPVNVARPATVAKKTWQAAPSLKP